MTESKPMTAALPQTRKSETHTLALLQDERLSELLLSNDSPVVGPVTAGKLQSFADTPEPPLATQGQVETMLGKLAMATAQARLSDAEVDERFNLYWLALNDIPADDLRAGFVDIVRGKTFLPVPAEIRTAALRHGAVRKYAKSRAKHLVWLHEREWQEPTADFVDPAEVRALVPRAA
ncbi:hypothetical protein HME9302_00964 [Alteripontixanthobacter maritimus]|uniref:Uncharacterized protein n=1 Tax=Alteripontixanthobacter maritimus TaxID=2161824 RepID=A0A369QA32_9SPHN|nr:hypothetical protein [Alteripontixanthobacter maritimus]RDC59769.1 hypothetical protein HME9302_00964 [Alteripontixanthobacter maritimus]